jgi:hypothetical protein
MFEVKGRGEREEGATKIYYVVKLRECTFLYLHPDQSTASWYN